ncbi:E3 ubiquitin-protein ligase TRIM71-like [Lytechinus variegatus]|uniref:E3 ubiquitin-protein ligase TRIM71-like n=1 Tax=Lytechinus variegatus TaxID=7654 RepID=UPI001BB2C085|nr:E3 ubiquitin-protein ligase TRIM71-like [Lytechinus variegatus]
MESLQRVRAGGQSLYCETHDKVIELYCTTHGAPLCNLCASVDHNGRDCVRQDIDDVIREYRPILVDLKETVKDKLKSARAYEDDIENCKKITNTHLQAVECDINATIQEAIKTEVDREKENAEEINREFEEKDRTREERLELNRANFKERMRCIECKQHGLQRDIRKITEETSTKIAELEKSWKDETIRIQNVIQSLEAILAEDSKVATEGYRLKMKVTDEIQKPVDNGVEVGVEIISEGLSGARFVKGVGNDKYDGRIGGYDGEWMLSDTISVNDEITNPCIVGSVDGYNLVISNFDGDTFTFDMNTRQSKRVIEGSDTSMVLSCAFLKDGKIVCGRQCEDCTGDALTGCISVYDRKWVHINDVTIPRNAEGDTTWVNVAVSKDGLIMAAEQFQSQIYHIDPINGKIVNTISCKEKLATLSGGLAATEGEEEDEEADFFIHSFLSADVMTIVTDEELFITDGCDILWKQPLILACTSVF